MAIAAAYLIVHGHHRADCLVPALCGSTISQTDPDQPANGPDAGR